MTNVSYRPAVVDIDLDAITTNASIMAQEFAPSMLCVAVKANAYGHGAVPVSRAVLAGGARGLAVATVDEGVELRDAGIDAPILLLSHAAYSSMPQVVRSRLTPVLYSKDALQAYSKAVVDQGLHRQPVHLKVDTGMHRVGATLQEFIDLCKAAAADKNVFVEGVLTHFALADDPDDPFTNLQATRFKQVLKTLFPNSPPPFAHCANSPAALLYPSLRLDMVRCGLATYGQQPSAKVPLLPGMKPAMTIRTEVSLVRDLEPGGAVGYGQTYRLTRRTRMATVPVGYADGIPRALGNRGFVLIRGKRFPIAGRVSMDQFNVDLGDDRSVEVGDEVVILGSQGSETITSLEIADHLDTINYEVLSRIGARLPRRYFQGGAAVDIRQQRIEDLATIQV